MFSAKITLTTSFQRASTLLAAAGLTVSETRTQIKTFIRNLSTTATVYAAAGYEALPVGSIGKISPSDAVLYGAGLDLNNLWLKTSSGSDIDVILGADAYIIGSQSMSQPSDTDKGDITVTSSGTVWTIDNGVVTLAKMADLAQDLFIVRTTASTGVPQTATCTAAGRAILDDADAAAQRVTLGLVIGTNVQAYDADLLAIAGLTSAADKGIQFTGAGTAAVYDLTTAGKALLDDADAPAQLITLGLNATAAEINQLNDVSVYQESVVAAGAMSVTKVYTGLAVVGGGAVTLAVPSATMLGQLKTIEMTTDDGDVTFALTNVVGQSAGTGATFNSVGDSLVLLALAGSWLVIKEHGIVLA